MPALTRQVSLGPVSLAHVSAFGERQPATQKNDPCPHRAPILMWGADGKGKTGRIHHTLQRAGGQTTECGTRDAGERAVWF